MLQKVNKKAHGKSGHNSNGSKKGMKLYRSYNFIDKDPVIDRMRTMVQDEGLEQKNVAILSGVSASTLTNWFEGDTRRPQYATIAAVTMALGYIPEFVKEKKVNYQKEIEKATAEIAEVKAKEERRKARAST